jgi:FkbM family methyltransferase
MIVTLDIDVDFLSIRASDNNMSIRQRIFKPGYIYRPEQLVQRLLLRGDPEPVVRLPWHYRIKVHAAESIGGGIARTGHHELAVTEAAFRLLGPGDVAVDVGANVGYFTSLMAYRVGASGKVLAFEPHPVVRGLLEENVARWRSPQVNVDARAISATSGSMYLNVPEGFSANMGTATLESAGPSGVRVDVTSLDEALGSRKVDLVKLDVEGHELAALDGARTTLAESRISHVLFEDHQPLPSPVSLRLSEAGFSIFALKETLRGIELVSPSDPAGKSRWDAPTYLATREPEDVMRRLRPNGWRSLRPRSRF